MDLPALVALLVAPLVAPIFPVRSLLLPVFSGPHTAPWPLLWSMWRPPSGYVHNGSPILDVEGAVPLAMVPAH